MDGMKHIVFDWGDTLMRDFPGTPGPMYMWERIEVPANKCPRITPGFLEEERRALGPWFFDQEYLCQFRDTVDSVFSYELIEAALDPTLKPLFGRRNLLLGDS